MDQQALEAQHFQAGLALVIILLALTGMIYWGLRQDKKEKERRERLADQTVDHFVSSSCEGENCGVCWREGGVHVQSTHKIGEEVALDDPFIHRHNLTQYVCCSCFTHLMGFSTPCKPQI